MFCNRFSRFDSPLAGRGARGLVSPVNGSRLKSFFFDTWTAIQMAQFIVSITSNRNISHGLVPRVNLSLHPISDTRFHPFQVQIYTMDLKILLTLVMA
jgi:hypothetical protein